MPVAFAHVSTAIKNEWVRLAIIKPKYAPDYDLVVAALINVLGLTLKTCCIVGKHWNPFDSLSTVHALESVLIPLRKPRRNTFLVHCEYIDPKMVGPYEDVVVARIIRDAPKHERRVH